ncbi:MAG: phenylacetic acid degradation operon transcriptional regulator, paaX family [Parcubacteria group bacterium Gr01-1014_72]|nr:MAG: phenylacetic acid degradation operon transcriptional regulator, paaX family [Parcubacteria group bacterium Gr01-1014_72]
MGLLEERTKKRGRQVRVQKAILSTIATAGLVSIALLAPNALQVLKQFGWKPHRRSREVISRARARLLEHGLLTRDGRGFLSLTPKGEAKLRQLEYADYKLKKPKRWDGKWRVLIFDIPERRKRTRERIRRTLATIGFRLLQRSVWVYPYDCEDLIALLKADFKVGKNLLYLIVEEMEGDRMLRDYFGLPPSNS